MISSILILGLWLAWFLVFVGIGAGVVHLVCAFARRDNRASQPVQGVWGTSVVDCFWLGWAVIIFLLQIWHCVAPVNIWSLVSCVTLGCSGWIWRWRDLRPAFLVGSWASVALFTSASMVIVTWLAIKACSMRFLYDHNLYYSQQILWVKSFPIIPGLANLHDRLGFFDGNFLYTAMLDVYPWIPGFRLSASLLLTVLVMQSMGGIVRVVKNGSMAGIRDVFFSLMLVSLLVQANLGFSLNTAATDTVVNVLSVVVFGYFLDFLERLYQGHEPWRNIFMITILSMAGVIIKGSFLSIGSWVVAAAYLLWVFQAGRTSFGRRVSFFGIVIVFFIGFVPFVMRNILVTGYVFYPFPYLSLPVDWRLPLKMVTGTAQGVLSWSRAPFMASEVVLKDTAWLGPWIFRMTHAWVDVVIPGILFVIASCILGVRVYFLRSFAITLKMWCIFLAVVAACLLTWFLSAPGIRFMGMLLSVLAAGSVAFVLMTFKPGKCICRIIAAIIVIFILTQAVQVQWKFVSRKYFYPLFELEVKPFTTDSGLIVYVPMRGDQCNHIPVLCTPHPQAKLAARCPDNLRCGFRIAVDGDNRQ